MHTAGVSLSVDVPDEPADRAVVLDRDAFAWQRHGDYWVRCGGPVPLWGQASGRKPWHYLVVDRQPLTPLITEGDCPGADTPPAGVTRADRGDLEDDELEGNGGNGGNGGEA